MHMATTGDMWHQNATPTLTLIVHPVLCAAKAGLMRDFTGPGKTAYHMQEAVMNPTRVQ